MMKTIDRCLIAENSATQIVRQNIIQLFTELGYQFRSRPETSLILAIEPTLETKISLTSNRLSGKTPSSLFQGGVRLILQQLMGKSQPQTIQPALEEQILMLDIGRKYYSLAKLKRLIRSLALFQFTHLQLHFSENEGFGIESLLHPEICSPNHLSQEEIRELIAYARKFYLEIIPDIDTPGHVRQLLTHHPEWCLLKADGSRETSALDILNPEAVDFIKEIYQEFAELFQESRYFHIGADEFVDFDQLDQYPSLTSTALKLGSIASGINPFIQYVNDLIHYLNGFGFIVRVWNDGFYRNDDQEHIHLTNQCEVSYWTRWNPHMAALETYLTRGYTMINHNDNFLYYVLGEAAGYQYPTYEKINEHFQLTTFASDQKMKKQNQTKGVALSVWADIPEAKSSHEVLADIFWLQAALSEKVYGDKNKKDDYQEVFEQCMR